MNTKHKFSCSYSDFSEDPGDYPLAWTADRLHFGWSLGPTGQWWTFVHTDRKKKKKINCYPNHPHQLINVKRTLKQMN